jgi:hypothetical protein
MKKINPERKSSVERTKVPFKVPPPSKRKKSE